MVILRRTQKLHTALPLNDTPARSDTALGDWYVNRLVVDRRPILLIVSSASLLPILVLARDVRGLPGRLAEVVAERLVRLGAAAPLIVSERRVMTPVHVGPTADRSVVGIMVDFAKLLPYHLSKDWQGDSLASAEASLAGTPCHAGKRDTVWPDEKARELLVAKWKHAR
jgi:hypothetical protein